MRKNVILLCVLCLLNSPSSAQQLNSLTCVPTEKISVEEAGKLQNYPKRYFEKWQPSVRIIDSGSSAILQRCGLRADANRIDCDSYKADHVERTADVKITKYYYYRGQFDVQVFSDMSFIENNGRGSLAFGKCTRG